MLQYHHLDKADSTNAYLQRKQSETDIRDWVVSTDEQTAGKGMGNNGWESEAGMNLTFSLALDMGFLPAERQFLLSEAVPLGIVEVLDTLLPAEKLFIKWPNDIYFDNRKMGGILINSTIKANLMDVSIIGIGLNVNQMQFQDWPTHPISMKMILGKEVALEPLLKQLVDAVDRRVQLLHDIEGVEIIKNDYLNRLYRYRTWSDYEVNGQKVRRFITGIDEFGRLETLDESKQKCVYDIKEIKFL